MALNFYRTASLDVIAIIFHYADHMDAIQLCEDTATTCLSGYAWSAFAIDEIVFEANALEHAMAHMAPSLSNLTVDDGRDVMVAILRVRVHVWCQERTNDIYSYMVTSFPPIQTAFKMLMCADDEWTYNIHFGVPP